MADKRKLMRAVELGREGAKRTNVPNPFKPGTLEHIAFECGYDNDLHGWLDLFNGRPIASGAGRFHSHEVVLVERDGFEPSKAWFCKYQGHGMAMVRIKHTGTLETVPTAWLKHILRDGVAA